MENIINKSMQTPSVKQAIERLQLTTDDMWNIYFDSGLEYLNILESRIRHKRVFDAMFKFLLNNPKLGKMSPANVLKSIRFSPVFWAWWSSQLWVICRQKNTFQDSTELFFRLQFNDSLIPHFILKQIFYGRQKPEYKKAANRKPADQASISSGEAGDVGKRIESRV